MRSLDDASFAQLLQSPHPVVVKLTAHWCAPCRAMQPHLLQAETQLAGSVEFVEADSDRAPSAHAALGRPSIPTIVVLRAGRELARHTGAIPAPLIVSFVRRALGA